MKFIQVIVPAIVLAAKEEDDTYRAGQGDRVTGGKSGIGGDAIIGEDCEIMGHWGCRSVIVDDLCCGKAVPDKDQTGNTATETLKVCNLDSLTHFADPND